MLHFFIDYNNLYYNYYIIAIPPEIKKPSKLNSKKQSHAAF